jgi:O-antigen/teichoic acid export membrane protein
MTGRLFSVFSKAVAAVVVVLLARSIAYAIAPTSAARMLEHRAGGPALPVLTLVALALGGSFAIAICWLAAFGVRERALFERRALAEAPPRFHVVRMVVVAVALSAITSVAGGLFEAYLHWRAGLGWHGIQCVFGPVHRDLLPIATALSFVSAAVIAAGEHIVAWMRRTFSLLRRLPPRDLRVAVFLELLVGAPSAGWRVGSARPRAPPAFS